MEGVGLRRLLRVELLRLQQISLGRWVTRFDGWGARAACRPTEEWFWKWRASGSDAFCVWSYSGFSKFRWAGGCLALTVEAREPRAVQQRNGFENGGRRAPTPFACGATPASASFVGPVGASLWRL